MSTLVVIFVTFFALWIIVPVFLALTRLFGWYAIVQERTCRVYVLFGKVVGTLTEPGLHFSSRRNRRVGVHHQFLWKMLRAGSSAGSGIPPQ